MALIEASLDADKARELKVIDLAGKTDIADTMIIASGTSSRHVMTLAGHLEEKLKHAGHPPLSVEGLDQGNWVLLDAGDVIVHLFRPEVRAYYDLEKMWSVPRMADASMA